MGWTGVEDMFAGNQNFFFAYGGPKCDPETLARGLGETYEVGKTNIKRWPVGGPIQAPLDSLSYLIKTHKLKADDIEKVVIRVSHQGAATVNNRSMPNVSMQQMVAVMLLDGTVTQASANDVKRMQNPQAIELRRRVELYGDDEMDRVRPVRQGIVELKLRDGRELRHRTTEVRGMAQNPMTRDEVADKCLGLCAPILGMKQSRALIDAIWDIERVNNVRALRPLLQG
jgi:2-methylcitrate dehydratase PrpD